MGKCSFNDLLKSKIDKNYPYIIFKKRIYKAGEKEKLLKLFLQSGQTQKKWCEENCVGLSTLQRWLSELRKKTKQEIEFLVKMKLNGYDKEFVDILVNYVNKKK